MAERGGGGAGGGGGGVGGGVGVLSFGAAYWRRSGVCLLRQMRACVTRGSGEGNGEGNGEGSGEGSGDRKNVVVRGHDHLSIRQAPNSRNQEVHGRWPAQRVSHGNDGENDSDGAKDGRLLRIGFLANFFFRVLQRSRAFAFFWVS